MRKKRVKGGGQHTMSCKIDNNKWEWLQHEENKNRVINQGLWWWKHQQQKFQGEDFMEHLEECSKKGED